MPLLDVITEEGLKSHTRVLASAEFQGRMPATVGEEKTIKYLTECFQSIGFAKDSPDATIHLQQVPLRRYTPVVNSGLSVEFSAEGSECLELRHDSEFVSSLSTQHSVANDVSAGIVFVGYGIVAPEYGWNDYAGLDVKHRWVLVLVNDPGFASEDPALFNGRTMTYYGRWSYKFEEAARQGAAGCIIVHNTGGAGYDFSVVQQGRRTASFLLADDPTPRCLIDAWITEEAAGRLFERCGRSYAECAATACKRGFVGFELEVTRATAAVEVSDARLSSSNVVAVLKGTHAERCSEAIVYSAHWDHFGVTERGICYGARDNALSVAAVLELARAHSLHPCPRSVVFFIPTVEEQGLLGSLYYTQHPLVPIDNTVACLNMDMLNIFGRTSDICFYGDGKSELDEYARQAARLQGRTVCVDPVPESGLFYRSDHFSFAKAGVPGMFIYQGFEHSENGREWMLQQAEKWVKTCYHKPMDTFVEDPENEWCWRLDGAVEDVQLLLLMGHRLANEDTFPQWLPGAEFARKEVAGRV